MKLLQIKINNEIYFVGTPSRVLEPYEFRSVPGRLVKGMHLGKPLIDLGILTGSKSVASPKGFIYEDFGFVTDAVEGEIEIDDASMKIFPKMVWEQNGAVVKGTVELAGKKHYLLNESLNRHWKSEIETELKARKWL